MYFSLLFPSVYKVYFRLNTIFPDDVDVSRGHFNVMTIEWAKQRICLHSLGSLIYYKDFGLVDLTVLESTDNLYFFLSSDNGRYFFFNEKFNVECFFLTMYFAHQGRKCSSYIQICYWRHLNFAAPCTQTCQFLTSRMLVFWRISLYRVDKKWKSINGVSWDALLVYN